MSKTIQKCLKKLPELCLRNIWMTLSFCIASLIFTFPAKMNIKPVKSKQGKGNKIEPQDCNENNENSLSPPAKLDYGKLQDLPKTLFGLVKNLPFMGITLAATMDGFLLAGKTTD